MTLLDENDMSDVPVFVGGIIPKEDIPFVESLGITAVFGPGSSLTEITEIFQEKLARE
jgi:methylmalonyl-CoA mutase C-terminal domain/subunit